MDYDIQQKRDLDKQMRQMLQMQLDAGGEYPNEIIVSPCVYKKLEHTFTYIQNSMFLFDDIPIKLDDTLTGEQIIFRYEVIEECHEL